MQTCAAPLGVICSVSTDGCPSCSSKSRRAGPGRKRTSAAAPLRVDLSGCKYELLRLVAARLGWVVVGAGDPADLVWTDTSISCERLAALGPTQRINHFHGMLALCRKAAMARLLTAMAAAAPTGAYAFAPPAWLLPAQLPALLADAKARGRQQAYIIKPDAGCQGRGIALVQGGQRLTLLKALAALPPAVAAPAVAQHYLSNPALIGGHKYDLRLYVLVAGVDPLRVYLYEEGLVRFATRPYATPAASNLATSTMHLTNYAVNKAHAAELAAASAASAATGIANKPDATDVSGGSIQHQDGVPTSHSSSSRGGSDGAAAGSSSGGPVGVSGTKWSLAQLRAHLEAQGVDWQRLWASISCLVVKSLLAVAPALAAAYTTSLPRNSIMERNGPGPGPGTSSSLLRRDVQGRTKGNGAGGGLSSAAMAGAAGSRCFEVLGFDVLLDAQLSPWLVEVNHSPSFNIDTPLDRAIKEALLLDTLHLMRVDGSALRAAKTAARRAAQARLMAPAAAGGFNSSRSTASTTGSISSSSLGSPEELRAALTRAQDKWEVRHAGGFTRVYPAWPQHIKGRAGSQPLHTPGPSTGRSSSRSMTPSVGVGGANHAGGSSRSADSGVLPAAETPAEQAADEAARCRQQHYEELLAVAHSVWRQLPAASAIRSNGGYDTVAAAAAAALASNGTWAGSSGSKPLRVAMAKKAVNTAGGAAEAASNSGCTTAASAASDKHDHAWNHETAELEDCSSTASSSSSGGGRPSVVPAPSACIAATMSQQTDHGSNAGDAREAAAITPDRSSIRQGQQQQKPTAAQLHTSTLSGRMNEPGHLPVPDQGVRTWGAPGSSSIRHTGGGQPRVPSGTRAPSGLRETGPSQQLQTSRSMAAAPAQQHSTAGEPCQSPSQSGLAMNQRHTRHKGCMSGSASTRVAADGSAPMHATGGDRASSSGTEELKISPADQMRQGPQDLAGNKGGADDCSKHDLQQQIQQEQQQQQQQEQQQGTTVLAAGHTEQPAATAFAGVEALHQLLQEALATSDMDPWSAQLAAATSSTRWDKGRRPATVTGSSGSSTAGRMALLASRLQSAQGLARRHSVLVGSPNAPQGTERPITAPTGSCRGRQQQPGCAAADTCTPTPPSGRQVACSRRAASAGGGRRSAAGAGASSCSGDTYDAGSASWCAVSDCGGSSTDIDARRCEAPSTRPVSHLAVQQQEGTTALGPPASSLAPSAAAAPTKNVSSTSTSTIAATATATSARVVPGCTWSSSDSDSNQATGLHAGSNTSSPTLPSSTQLPPLACSRGMRDTQTSRVAPGKAAAAPAASNSCSPRQQYLLSRLLTPEVRLMGGNSVSGSSSPLSVAGLTARAALVKPQLATAASGMGSKAVGPVGAGRRSSGGWDVLPCADSDVGSAGLTAQKAQALAATLHVGDVPRFRRFPSFHPVV